MKKKRTHKTTKKRRGDSNRGSETRKNRAARWESGLLGKTRKPREDRHVLVALTMSSLVAGLLFVVNFDRSLHSARALEMGKGTSLHGWPFVYLHREFPNLTSYLVARQTNPWPIPVVEGETRTMNLENLGIDILVCSTMVVLCYFVVRYIVFKYDQWKKTWS